MANMTSEVISTAMSVIEVDQFSFKTAVFTAAAKEYPVLTVLALNVAGTKYVPFVSGADDSTGVAVAVLTSAFTATAGDNNIRLAQKATVKSNDLVIDADGDASNVNAKVIQSLNANGITCVTVKDVSVLDNQ